LPVHVHALLSKCCSSQLHDKSVGASSTRDGSSSTISAIAFLILVHKPLWVNNSTSTLPPRTAQWLRTFLSTPADQTCYFTRFIASTFRQR